MDRNIIFRPAVEPLEAAVLPAKQERPRGALHLAQAYWQWEPCTSDRFCGCQRYREKKKETKK